MCYMELVSRRWRGIYGLVSYAHHKRLARKETPSGRGYDRSIFYLATMLIIEKEVTTRQMLRELGRT